MAQGRSSSGRDGDRDPGKHGDQEGVPLIQWIVSGIAVLVVLGSFGLIAYDGFIARRGPPSISVAVDSIGRTGALHRVHVTVRNDGGSAAADVQVSGELDAGASPPTMVLLDYLPAGSREAAVFVFTRDPREAGLRVRVESWNEP
ncbi:MAG TPA: hypothetical protein VFU06_01220 [Longimicrobiales bacterium]|nr:hypothetical protein [Longimicrobiales bacterium]